MYTCTKKFANFPFAHRQPSHPGHCRLIHGHNWAFTLTFGCHALEPGTGFVIDFGGLGWLKDWLNSQFDHTLVLNNDDPVLPELKGFLGGGGGDRMGFDLAEIRCVPNCGAEGLARFIFDEIEAQLNYKTDGRVFLCWVIVKEDEKNSACYMRNGGCAHV